MLIKNIKITNIRNKQKNTKKRNYLKKYGENKKNRFSYRNDCRKGKPTNTQTQTYKHKHTNTQTQKKHLKNMKKM